MRKKIRKELMTRSLTWPSLTASRPNLNLARAETAGFGTQVFRHNEFSMQAKKFANGEADMHSSITTKLLGFNHLVFYAKLELFDHCYGL